MITDHQRKIRERYLSAPVVAAPKPWRKVLDRPVGGLLGIGFAVHPGTGSVVPGRPGGHRVSDRLTPGRRT
ncbi:hypothetical protein OIE78_18600 [Streptomyces cellulosae]